MNHFLTFISENLEHVAPILIAAALALVITIERTRALLFAYPLRGSAAFFDRIRNMVMSDRINEAIVLCDLYKEKPVVSVVKEGLIRAHQPENIIEHGLQIAVSEAMDRVQKGTSFLATIANVATLLGLFGTILGLIQSFEAVGNANAQQRSTLLANGISTAMNATMMGLAVAIPCMIAFSYLINRSNRLQTEIDRSAVKILDLLKQRYYSSDTPSPDTDTASRMRNHRSPGLGGT